MKFTYIFAMTLLISNQYLACMDPQKDANELTQAENDCYTWFKEQQQTLPPAFQQLSPEDRQVFETQVKFQDNPDAVTRSRHNFVEAFYASAQEAKRELLYDKEMLKNTFVKMTKMMHSGNMGKPKDLLSARMYVFSKLLTPEEKITYSQENYKKDSEATKGVIRKWSGLVCDELIELKQLEEAAKAQKAQELYDEVATRFEHTYNQQSALK